MAEALAKGQTQVQQNGSFLHRHIRKINESGSRTLVGNLCRHVLFLLFEDRNLISTFEGNDVAHRAKRDVIFFWRIVVFVVKVLQARQL